MSGDTWSSRHDACTRLGNMAMEAINERNQLRRQGGNPARASTNAQSLIKQFSTSLSVLRDDLMKASRTLSASEAQRRQRLLDELNSKEKQLKDGVRDDGRASGSGGAAGANLFGAGKTGYQRLHNEYADDEDTRGLGVDDLRARQKMAIRDQDDGLEALSHVISQQKNMALGIGDEIVSQNELIDDITNHAESTESRILRETRHVSIVDRKSNTCWYWVVIILLFITIIIIGVVPFNGKP